MNAKITVVSLDGVLVEGAVRKVSIRETIASAVFGTLVRASDAIYDARDRFMSLEEVRLLKEGTTEGIPLRGVRPKDRLAAIIAVGSVAAFIVVLASLVY